MDPISNMIVLLGGVRSGTTVFRQFLATNPKLTNCGEIFNSSHRGGFYSFLSNLCLTNTQAIIPENQVKIFKSYLLDCCSRCGENMPIIDIKYEHLRLLHRPWEPPFAFPLLLDFIKEKKLFVINLRRNPVDAVISNLLSIHRGVYHISTVQTALASDATLSIDPKAFSQQIRQRIKATRFISKFFFSYKKYLQLDYEDLFDKSSGQAVFSSQVSDKISGSIGIENDFDHRPRLKKVIDVPRDSLIRNYADLKETVATYDNYFRKQNIKPLT
jgi:hypothetical protein